MVFDAGSFRDPFGRIVQHDERIFRVVFEQGLGNFQAAKESGVLEYLVERGLVLPAVPVEPGETCNELKKLAPGGKLWVEHPKIPYISYPYEWCFSELKAAALLHLRLHIALLDRGFTLSDASAYNIQFRGTRPVFIDQLSIVRYEEGVVWFGQRQFGMQFLNPLYLWAKKGVTPHAWFRGTLEGIPPEDLAKLLGFKDRMSFTVLAHIVGQAAFARRRIVAGHKNAKRKVAGLSKPSLIAILKSLQDFISTLEPPFEKTIWDDYADNNSYGDDRREAKHRFVADLVSGTLAQSVCDIGCNSGDFSQTAVTAGAKMVVGFDFDHGALEKAFARFDRTSAPVLPLWLDAANPSPSQGWAGSERKSMNDRARTDCVLALAVIHHLAISRNVPLDMAVNWLMSLAPTGVIEFPSKNDPMVQQLLQNRPDIFPDYSEDNFLAQVGQRGRILKKDRLGEGGRLIISFDRRI